MYTDGKVSKLTRYKLRERDAAGDRDGWRCWFCGCVLHAEAGAGRAHIIADNKANNKLYGQYIMNNRRIVRMSCARHNSYATKYKPDPNGDIYFTERVRLTDVGYTQRKLGAFSLLTEEDKKKIIYECYKAVEAEGLHWNSKDVLNFKMAETISHITDEHKKASAEYTKIKNVFLLKLKYKRPRNLAEAWHQCCNKFNDLMSVYSGTKWNKTKAQKTHEANKTKFLTKMKELEK